MQMPNKVRYINDYFERWERYIGKAEELLKTHIIILNELWCLVVISVYLQHYVFRRSWIAKPT
jgi:hypothetical protein